MQPPGAPRIARPQSLNRPDFSPAPVVSPPVSSPHRLGLFAFSLYLFSAYGNDLSLRIIGAKAYLSWVSGALTLIALFSCGTPFRGLQSKIGKAWFALMMFLLSSTVFSIYRSDSVSLMTNYIPKSLFLFFYCCAFTLTIKQCRSLIVTNVVCASTILLTASLFGKPVDGRFCIPDSFFMGGGNDLALALVSSLGFTVFLLSQKSILAQLLGAGEFLLTIYFLLKTGSRGGLIAFVVFMLMWLMFSSSRAKLILLCVPALALIPFLPGSTLTRLTEFASSSSASEVGTNNEAIESQFEREMLLRKSIVFALTHPIFGVGPGQFIDALYSEDLANRTHTHALGTHNTYTQIASECGLPALGLYLVILFSSIGSNFRIMKRTRNQPGGERVFSMAFAVFGSLIAFAVATIFHHDAYAITLPVLSGLSAALAMATRNGDMNWILAEQAAGNA